MDARRTAGVVLAATVVAGCATGDWREGAGTLAGAGIGAAAGSKIGDLGAGIGRNLDEHARMKQERAHLRALDTGGVGTTIDWSSGSAGGHTRVLAEGRDRSTQAACRRYEILVTIEGEPEKVEGTACRQADGSWRDV